MRTVDSRPFMRDFFLLGRVNMPPGAAHRAALDAEPRASCRASSARLDVGATAATARWSLARRTRPLPRTLGAMTPLVRAGQGVRARRRLLLRRVTRPWRPSPRVVWWDSTGSSRSHGRLTRCARYARTHPRLRPGPRPTTTAPRRSSVIDVLQSVGTKGGRCSPEGSRVVVGAEHPFVMDGIVIGDVAHLDLVFLVVVVRHLDAGGSRYSPPVKVVVEIAVAKMRAKRKFVTL